MSDPDADDWPERHYPLVGVMDGQGDPGEYYDYREEVRLVKEDADRNLWSIHVHDEWVTAFDADDISSTAQLGRFLDRVLVAYESGDEDEQDEVVQEQDFDDLGGSAFQ